VCFISWNIIELLFLARDLKGFTWVAVCIIDLFGYCIALYFSLMMHVTNLWHGRTCVECETDGLLTIYPPIQNNVDKFLC